MGALSQALLNLSVLIDDIMTLPLISLLNHNPPLSHTEIQNESKTRFSRVILTWSHRNGTTFCQYSVL